MIGTMQDTPLTLPPLLDRAAALFGEREIVSRRPDRSLERCSYRALAARVDALARALLGAGLQPGDRVATLMWNQVEHLEAYFGIPLAGGVLHTLNLRLPVEHLVWIANDAADRFLIVEESLLPLLEHWRSRAPFERIFVVRAPNLVSPVDPAAPPDPAVPLNPALPATPLRSGYEDYAGFLASAPSGLSFPVLAETAPCGLCYTSGTTGHPKGVLYTHRSSVLHCLGVALVDSIGVSQRDSVLPVVPMFHVNAWGLPYAAVMVGAKLVLPGPHLDAVSLLDLCAGERVSLAAGVPSIWLGLLEALDREPGRWPLGHLRMIVGGAAAPISLIQGFDRHGLELIHAWGMTETSPLGTVSRLAAGLESLSRAERDRLRATQGLPVPLFETRIVADGSPQPHDGRALGELEVRGPWVARAYFGASDDPDRFTHDGWFRTGDVANIDERGYVKLVDRIKDLVKSGGEWISSVELENALMGHPGVREAAVIAVPHPRWGERPLAVVVCKPGSTPSADELRAHLAPQFPKWWLPEAIVFSDAIPKTSAGKFLKTALRERHSSWDWG